MSNIYEPLVSVIVPNYNHSKYLDRRISSILNQTYTNLELIILDDRSTDNSIEIISKYLDDKRIRGPYVNEINSGSPFFQWQKGINMAKGDWIWIAESDDYADARFLETSLKYLFEYNSIASFCSLNIVDVNENLIKCKTIKKARIYTPFTFSLINSTGPLVINTSSALFQKEAVKMVSSEFTKYRAYGDVVFWMELGKLGKICRCPEALSYFTIHSDSTSGSARTNGMSLQENSNFVEKARANGLINLFEYYLMVGDKLLLLTKYAHYKSLEFQKEQIQNWSQKVQFPQLSILLYRLFHKLFISNYTY